MARPSSAILIKQPIKVVYEGRNTKVQAQFKTPIRKQNNGGARISLPKEYADYEAIVLVTKKRCN